MCNKEIFTKKILLTISAIAALSIGSCEQDLTIEIKTNDKRLIVSGEFTSDTTIHSLRLCRSGSMITGKEQTVVSGAKIFVTNIVDTIYFLENKDTLGLYQTPNKCYGIGGNTYYLSITNIDVDEDGKKDSFSAANMMPAAITFDSLVSKYGQNGDMHLGIINRAYYKIASNGPDYVYNDMQINRHNVRPIGERLGSGEFSRFASEHQMYKEENTVYKKFCYFFIDREPVAKGDTLTFIGYNFTKDQFDFLIAFDNNTNGDAFNDNMYDQLTLPSNTPTNIEPSNKAAGYFFIYSISRISKVYNGE